MAGRRAPAPEAGDQVVELESIDDAARWDALLAGVGYSPWQQSRAYGAALAHAGRPVRRLRLAARGETLGVVQAVGRLAAGGRVGLWHALGGPLWSPGVAIADKSAGLAALERHLAGPWRRLVVTPALPAARTAAALEAAGMRRVMTGYTTAVLPIDASPQRQAARLQPNWRRLLQRARNPAAMPRCRDARADPAGLDAALALHERERRRRGYAAVSHELVAAAARRGPALLATVDGPDGPTASMLVFVHGATATYQVGWTSPAGRAAHAHHRLLWTILASLRERGVRLLDLGGLDLPAGIVHFKLATGALPRTFTGSYLAGAGLMVPARCPSRGSRASSRADSSGERRAPTSAARRWWACRAATAG
ncbi:MAG: GNAT family N-acetyltransferase [Alphaproteobacteria bacterium]|jgi:hypothetical protein|nr:GNAT family N-acetyltransferase [Alphaproteobacteria bacterium]